MDTVDLVRVVAVSPGDVRPEREALQTVIDELNRGVAVAQRRRLSLWRWEADARSGLHLLGPQGLIDEMMDIQSADLVIGVFWTRFGTPTHQAQSGTEHELRRAWAAWREHGRPDVMLYFCARSFVPMSSSESVQRQQLLAFRDAMPEQLWWEFEGQEDLERLAREHLTRYLLSLPADLTGRRGPSGPLQTRPRLRFNLPVALPYFTGRETELAALDSPLCQARVIQIKADDRVYVVRLNGHPPPRLKALLADPSIRKVMHHAMFDLRFMASHWGVEPRTVCCTKIASKLLAPAVPSAEHSLATLVRRRFGVELDKSQRVTDWTAALRPEQINYAADDVRFLQRLHEELGSELRQKGLLELRDSCFEHLPTRVRLELGGYPDVYDY